MYALAVAAGAAAWVVVGPVLITLLFLGVSIKLMEDRQLKNKGVLVPRRGSRACDVRARAPLWFASSWLYEACS